MSKQNYKDKLSKSNDKQRHFALICGIGAYLCLIVAIFCIIGLVQYGKTEETASAQTNTIQMGHLYSIDATYFFNYSFSQTNYFLLAEYFYAWEPFTLADVDENTLSYLGGNPPNTTNGFQIYYGSTYNYLYLGVNDNTTMGRRWVELKSNSTTITERIQWYDGSYHETNLQHNQNTSKLYFYARSDDFGLLTLNTGVREQYATAFLNKFKQYATDEGALVQSPQIEQGIAISGDFVGPNNGNWDVVTQIRNSEPLTEFALYTITCTNPNNQTNVSFYVQCVTSGGGSVETILDVPVYNGVCRFFICAPENTTAISIRFWGETTFTVLSADIVQNAIANGKLLRGNIYTQYKAYGEEIGAQNAQNNNLVNLIFAAMDAPIKILFGTYDNTTHLWSGGLFSFTVLGVDLRAFAAGLLSFCLIIAIVKLVLGMRK